MTKPSQTTAVATTEGGAPAPSQTAPQTAATPTKQEQEPSEAAIAAVARHMTGEPVVPPAPPKPEPITAPAAPEGKAPDTAPEPEAPDTEDGSMALAEALVAAPSQPNSPKGGRAELQAQLEGRGMPAPLAKALAHHGSKQDIQAWLSSQPVAQSPTDSASQPKAAPTPTPAASPGELDVATLLAGVRESLIDSGALEMRDAESLTSVLETIAARQTALEQSLHAQAHQTAVERYRSEIQAGREGLKGQFPGVLDNQKFNDQVRPIFEALATSETTRGRTLTENLEAACRAAFPDAGAGSRSRNTEPKPTPQAPRGQAASAATISQLDYSAGIVELRMRSAPPERLAEWEQQWRGRIV